jgi:hypothetical protein
VTHSAAMHEQRWLRQMSTHCYCKVRETRVFSKM